MSLEDLKAAPPAWAIDAGLPRPERGETFVRYVSRLGFDADALLADLTDQTAVLAHYRLSTKLGQAMPAAYDRYVADLVARHVPKSRQRSIRGER